MSAGVWPGITDLQVGSYVTMDLYNREYGLDFAQAVSVLATVVSRPEPARAITDAGLKSLSTDHGLPRAVGQGIDVARLDEEHGRLTLSGPARELRVGDTVELIPSHGCTTIPLHEQYVLMRGSCVEGVAPIPARGALYQGPAVGDPRPRASAPAACRSPVASGEAGLYWRHGAPGTPGGRPRCLTSPIGSSKRTTRPFAT